MVEWLWRFAGRAAGPRDGQADALVAAALEGSALAGAGPAVPAVPAVRGREHIEAALAAKVLGAHLANRRQISYPLVLNFASVSPLEGAFLMDAAGAAASSEGEPDARRLEEAAGRLARLGAGEGLLARFRRSAAEPLPMAALAARAAEYDKAAHAYAASLVAIGSRSAVGRLYLAYLAARLGLGAEAVGSLNRRFLS